MAKKVLTFLIKSDIKQVAKDTEILLAKLENTNKETKDLTNNFGAFGITVGSIKKKFADVAKIVNNGLKTFGLNAQIAGKAFQLMFGGEVRTGAKVLFGVIKKGIAATGIGLFALALGSVVTFLTKTKKGAELLERTLAGLGATFNVLRDRASGVGEALLNIFNKPLKETLGDIKDSFTGIGDEIVADTKAIVELKKSFQELRDSNRELRVETAESKAKIEELRLIATDTSKSIEERTAAAQLEDKGKQKKGKP
jgi:methyl-accepting chemotaxis protein